MTSFTLSSTVLLLLGIIKPNSSCFLIKSPLTDTVTAKRDDSTLLSFIYCNLNLANQSILLTLNSEEVIIQHSTISYNRMISDGFAVGTWPTALESHVNCNEVAIRIWNGYELVNETVIFELDIISLTNFSSIGVWESFTVRFEGPSSTTTTVSPSTTTTAKPSCSSSNAPSSSSQETSAEVVSGAVLGAAAVVASVVLVIVLVIRKYYVGIPHHKTRN